MLLKLGVDISRLLPPIRKKLFLIERVHTVFFNDEMVVTSTYEGRHMSGSLHYANLAIDIRLAGVSADFVNSLKKKLGRDYDIINESNHIHIEYDPKS